MGVIELHHIFLLRNKTFMRILRTTDWILAETRFPKAALNLRTRIPQRSWVIFQVEIVPPSHDGDNHIPAHETIGRDTIIAIELESRLLLPPDVLQRFDAVSNHQTIRPIHPAEKCALQFLARELQTSFNGSLSPQAA
jgi:hypothetical protein